MEIKYIEAFLKVVETGSFSTAAEGMYISQPTISTRIRKLEEELKTPLFLRNGGKKAILTQAGEKIFPYYKDAFHSIQKGNELLRASRPGFAKIRLSCPNHMGHIIFPDILKSLYEHYPNIDFNVKVSSSQQIIEDIRRGEMDAGIIFREGGEEHDEYTIIPIAMEKSVLVASAQHPLANHGHLHVSDLKNEKFIVFSKTSNKSMIFDRFLADNGLKVYQMIEIRNTEWIKNMVKSGIGISFLQTKVVEQEIQNGTLRELSLTKPIPTTPISIIIRNDVPAKIQYHLTETLKELFYT